MAEEPLSPLEAASAIRDLSKWSDQLRQRTTGLTWAFWGLVTPATFLTYAWGAAAGEADAPWFGLLWTPWAALGLLFTWLLWRATRVAPQHAPVSAREVAVHAALFLLATVGSVIAVLSLRLPFYPPTAVIMGIGLLAAMLGVRDAFASAEREVGLVQAVGGIALLVFGAAEASALAGAAASDAIQGASLANAIASAIVLVGIGVFRIARS